jgi:preprotein translocase subunit Sss1
MGLARTVAAVFGAVYLLVGIVGFILESPLLGLFEINALHNVVHVLLGAILLYGSMSYAAAVQTTRGVGALLVVLGLLGFVIPDGFGLVPLGGNDIWLHLATGAILLATGFLATEGSAATV